jgi:hypothetical protein
VIVVSQMDVLICVLLCFINFFYNRKQLFDNKASFRQIKLIQKFMTRKVFTIRLMEKT